MKTTFIRERDSIPLPNAAKIGLAALICAASAFAPRSRAQTLEAHESGTGNQTVSHWETTWGSYDRDYHQTKKIRITVRDVTRHSPDGEVRAYFIGRKQPDQNLFIYNHAILKVHFGGDMEVADEIDAPSLFRNELHYNALGAHYSHGAAMDGWIIEGRVGSRVFGTVASNQNLLMIAKSDSLQKMIAAAGIREPSPAPGNSPAATIPPSSKVPSVPAPPPSSAVTPSPAEVATLTAPTEIALPYGKTILPRGTKLKIVSRNGQAITVRYLDTTASIPISSTDLK